MASDLRRKVVFLLLISVGLLVFFPFTEAISGTAITAPQNVTYFVYDCNYPASPYVWISGMRYPNPNLDIDSATYAIKLDLNTNTFTEKYLSGAVRGYIPADNETHFAFAEMSGTNSFIIRKSDLSFITCVNAGSGTSAFFAAGFDQNNDVWWGIYDTAQDRNVIYKLHTSGCVWQAFPIPLGATPGHPYMGIQGGMFNSTIWFLKQGNGYLASYDIATGGFAEYFIAPASYPNVRVSEAIIDYATESIWMAGYGLGKIYRFSILTHALDEVDVSGIVGMYPTTTILYASQYLLIANLSPTIYVWDTAQLFSSSSVQALSTVGAAMSNLGGPGVSAGFLIGNNFLNGRFSRIVTKIDMGGAQTSTSTTSTSSSTAITSTTTTSTTSTTSTMTTTSTTTCRPILCN